MIERLFPLAQKSLGPLAIISITLGLAPFTPEPHLLGKLRWVSGGGHGMQLTDIFDLLLHGTPWVLLLLAGGVFLLGKKR